MKENIVQAVKTARAVFHPRNKLTGLPHFPSRLVNESVHQFRVGDRVVPVVTHQWSKTWVGTITEIHPDRICVKWEFSAIHTGEDLKRI